MRVAIYIRVSTDEQAKHGYSIGAQTDRLRAYCKSQGWTVYKIYSDEGFSAKDTNRPALQSLLRDMEKNLFDVVLVYKLDRLTRSVKDLYQLLEVFDEHDCKFKSATEIYDTTSATGRLFITLVAALAQWERENTAERVRSVMENNVKNGKWKGGTLAYGYKLVDGKIVIDKEEVAVVRFIFDKIKTMGTFSIVKELIAKGSPTRGGGDWQVDTIRGIVKNPFYIGYQRFNESIKQYKGDLSEQNLYESTHPSIIDEDDFWEVQQIINSRKGSGSKKNTSNYYFSSVLTCGLCGTSMSGHKGSNDQKTYRCNKKKGSGTCDSSIILEKTLERWLLSNLDNVSETLINNSALDNEMMADEETTINSFKKELAKIEKMKSKYKKMYENDIIDIDELTEKTYEFRSREKEIKDTLTAIQNQEEKNEMLRETLSNFQEAWEVATDQEKKFLISNIFTNITVHAVGEQRRSKPREIVVSSMY